MPKTLAGATVDRLHHHAHHCATTGDAGDGVWLAQATTGNGGHAPDPIAHGRSHVRHRRELMTATGENFSGP